MTQMLTLMCGLPGSGKSTMVKKYIEAHPRMQISVVSADHYFMRTGTWKFNPAELGEAHGLCFCHTIRLLTAEDEIDEVIVDNTMMTNIERAPYVLAAQAFGWQVRMVDLFTHRGDEIATYAARNVHGVPAEAIKRMAARYEKPLSFWPLTVVTSL
jgi:predicted ABC-type ATPase